MNKPSTLKEILFPSRLEQSLISFYEKTFSISEIASSKALQWLLGVTLFSYLVTFFVWANQSKLTISSYLTNNYTCWPWWQNCGAHYFFEALPLSYSQNIFYGALLGLILLGAYLIFKQQWTFAHAVLTLLFLWHAFAGLAFSAEVFGNYDYYLLVLAAILLFIPQKLFFLRLTFVLLYVLAASVKIDAGWIAGTYFTSLQTGLPLIPKAAVPLFTNLVIITQVVGSWFLLSRHQLIQRSVFSYFVIFHLYSSFIVGFQYPLIVLPTLITLFGLYNTPLPVPHSRNSLAGWLLVIFLCCLQLISFLIPGDVKLTLEGNQFGLYMFEANHQCISTATTRYRDGTSSTTLITTSINARNRCDPYQHLFHLQQVCRRDERVAGITWSFDHSINGEPFYRIVEVDDACSLTYKPFAHNDWIDTQSHAYLIGYPVQNIY